MKALFYRLPLRYSLPVMLLAAFLLATLISLFISMQQSRREVIEAVTHHASSETVVFARSAENELADHKHEVRRLIMLHAAETEDFRAAMTALLDPEGRVIFSFRTDWQGRAFGDVMRGWDSRRLERVQRGASKDILLDEVQDKFSMVKPFDYPRINVDITSRQKGAVYVEYDLRPAFAAARYREFQHHVPHLVVALLVFLLLAWWLRRNLSVHIERLSDYSRLIGAGKLESAIENGFPGELHQLGLNLTDMTAQLRADRLSLMQQRDLNRHYLDTVNAIVVVLDELGRIQMVNRKGCELLGYAADDLLGCNWFEVCLPQPEGMDLVYPVFRKLMAGEMQSSQYFENTIQAKSGARYLVSWHNSYFTDAQNKICGAISSGEDVTLSRQQEINLRKLSQAVEQSPENIFITDLAANIEYVNAAFLSNTGYSREEIIGKNPRFLQSGKTPGQLYAGLWHALLQGEVWQGEFFNRRKDGTEFMVAAVISPVRDDGGNITHYLAVEQDITDSRAAEQTIRTMVFYDALTGLSNRTMLLDRMEMILPFARRQKRQDALVVLNIDRFKTLNDARGQEAGDALLKLVAGRLTDVLREGDLLSRTGGDEFAILLHELALRSEDATLRVLHIAENIQNNLQQPFQLDDEQVALTASMGIALFPQSVSDTPLDILRRANTALHQAKAKGGGYSAFFESNMDEVAKQRFQIERELRAGIVAGELRLFLQPQVDAQGRMVGAEALVRWQHPVRGLLTPFAFIQIAEESNLIVELGNWVLEAVCKLLAQEIFLGRPFRIAVNVSPRQFRHVGFAEGVLKLLNNTGAEPNHLTLEVTEGLMLQDVSQVIATMSSLAATGIHFSVDDFGTGYSSLAYLKRLPINELKIDKTFVQDAPTDPDDAALVDTILSLAQHLHLQVVAEGVETQEQADFLNAHGTVIHQGYFFGKPEPAESLLKKLK
jgi:diguanylate cyclase (GGDEF)-like protein/PAS domain S-box-containing protein